MLCDKSVLLVMIVSKEDYLGVNQRGILSSHSLVSSD